MERTKLEEDFSSEMENFSNHWFNKINSYQEECKMMEQELIEHNKKSLDEYHEYLKETIPEKPKDSTKLINLKSTIENLAKFCLLYTSPSPRDRQKSRMPSSA